MTVWMYHSYYHIGDHFEITYKTGMKIRRHDGYICIKDNHYPKVTVPIMLMRGYKEISGDKVPKYIKNYFVKVEDEKPLNRWSIDNAVTCKRCDKDFTPTHNFGCAEPQTKKANKTTKNPMPMRDIFLNRFPTIHLYLMLGWMC